MATVPDAVTKLVKLGFAVVVEQGAGELADLSDVAFVEAGATIAPSAAALWSGTDEHARMVLLQLRLPRLLAALGVGAALGLAGALMQLLTRRTPCRCRACCMPCWPTYQQHKRLSIVGCSCWCCRAGWT